MRFLIATTIALVSCAVAAPVSKRAVFSSTTFDDISISGGVAGNAQAEAEAALSNLSQADLATLEKADLDFLNEVNQVANDAEKEAFNPAIEAASGDEATALQNGKIKNKVLKLTATIMKLNAQAAQGEDVADKLADETKKLNNNISQDEAAAGEPSTALPFDATISA